MYCGVMLDQSMILNRRKYEDNTKGLDEKVSCSLLSGKWKTFNLEAYSWIDVRFHIYVQVMFIDCY